MSDEIRLNEQHNMARAPKIEMSHKQFGLTATGIAALTAALVGPLSQFFQTKLDASKQTASIQLQASQIVDLKATLEANKKEIIESFQSVVKPIAKDVDRHETRIVNLEFLQMKRKN